MSVSRNKILVIIRQNNGVSVDDLSRELGLAQATVRRHLDILERDDLVSHTEIRRPADRPRFSFFLTEHGHESVPKDYGRLLGELVSEIRNTPVGGIDGRSGQDVIVDSLTRIGQKRATEYAQGRQLVDAVRAAFEAGGYDPIFEKSDAGMKIRIRNCPYRQIAAKDDIICTVDRSLIQVLFGDNVEHQKEMSEGSNECSYEISTAQLEKVDAVTAGD